MSELIERIAQTYDELPYISSAFTQTAPEHLHAVAKLFGLDTPPPARARVLELGCAAGGNLIPFAARHPAARALGVDLSTVQVKAGNQAIRSMGLNNIRLLQASITELGADIGLFDYIICHGVYSWVPEDVREAILRLSRERLAPQGVAYVSYNVYPGWKAKEIVRDAMLLRTGPHQSASEKLGYARGMIDFLHDMAHEGSLLQKVMQDHIQMIRHGHEPYLVHEFLEICNAPCYFRDFTAAASRHGLTYLADSNTASMFASNYGSKAAEPLLRECGGSQMALEQLLDFLTNRTFRQTLLVHEKRAGEIQYQLDPAALVPFHLCGRFSLAEGGSSAEGPWQAANGSLVAGSPKPWAMLIERLTSAWPASVPVAALIEEAQAAGGADPQQIRQAMLQAVQQLVIIGAVRVRLEAIRTRPEAIGPCPVAPEALRRLAALRREKSVPISLYNLWHETLPDEDVVEAVLLPLLDGRHDRAALRAALLEAARAGQLQFVREGQPIEDADALTGACGEHLEAALKRMSDRALFMAMD